MFYVPKDLHNDAYETHITDGDPDLTLGEAFTLGWECALDEAETICNDEVDETYCTAYDDGYEVGQSDHHNDIESLIDGFSESINYAYDDATYELVSRIADHFDLGDLILTQINARRPL